MIQVLDFARTLAAAADTGGGPGIEFLTAAFSLATAIVAAAGPPLAKRLISGKDKPDVSVKIAMKSTKKIQSTLDNALDMARVDLREMAKSVSSNNEKIDLLLTRAGKKQ